MTEDLRRRMHENPAKINTLFYDRYRQNITNEGILRDLNPQYDKFDWFIKPWRNGTIDGFTPSEE